MSGVEVAVKGLPPVVRNNTEELERIRENFALVARLHHPNIAAALHLHRARKAIYHDGGVRGELKVDPGDTLMVMEYAPGVTLSQWSKQFPDRIVPVDRAVGIVRQVAQALDYAHGRRVLHRDVKPANIMVETAEDGTTTVRVLDFGLAAEMRSSMGRVSLEIHDTSGTRPYMAPEQWRGARQGAATDQYALAVLFCELVTGEVPFSSVFDTGDPILMKNAVVNDRPEFVVEFPKGVADILQKALAKKPEERFVSCVEFVERVSRMAGMPVMSETGLTCADDAAPVPSGGGVGIAGQLRDKADAILDVERTLAETIQFEDNCKGSSVHSRVHSSLIAIKSARNEMDAASLSRCLELRDAAKDVYAEVKSTYEDYVARRRFIAEVSSFIATTGKNREICYEPNVKDLLGEAEKLKGEVANATSGSPQEFQERFLEIQRKVEVESKKVLEARREQERRLKLEGELRNLSGEVLKYIFATRRENEFHDNPLVKDRLREAEELAARIDQTAYDGIRELRDEFAAIREKVENATKHLLEKRHEQEVAERKRQEEVEFETLKSKIEIVRAEIEAEYKKVVSTAENRKGYEDCIRDAKVAYRTACNAKFNSDECLRVLEESLSTLRGLIDGHDVVVCAALDGVEIDGVSILYGKRVLCAPLRIVGRRRFSDDECYQLRYKCEGQEYIGWFSPSRVKAVINQCVMVPMRKVWPSAKSQEKRPSDFVYHMSESSKFAVSELILTRPPLSGRELVTAYKKRHFVMYCWSWVVAGFYASLGSGIVGFIVGGLTKSFGIGAVCGMGLGILVFWVGHEGLLEKDLQCFRNDFDEYRPGNKLRSESKNVGCGMVFLYLMGAIALAVAAGVLLGEWMSADENSAQPADSGEKVMKRNDKATRKSCRDDGWKDFLPKSPPIRASPSLPGFGNDLYSRSPGR